MEIDPLLIGHLTATVFEVLLVHAGYQVVPTGIERTIRELRTVEAGPYIRLAPKPLRAVPDFFVLDLENNESWMAEVKFRQRIRPSFMRDLEVMQERWGDPFVLILTLAEPPEEWKGEVRHIRVFQINEETDLGETFLREHGERLQDVFRRLKEKWHEGTILKAQDAVLRFVSE